MKKLLCLIISGVMVLSAIPAVSAATTFSDMPDDWSTAALTAAVENGLLTGSDGLILAKDNLTRAQMATIIVRALDAESTASLSEFKDVPESKWYYEYMSKAVAMGVFNGDGTGLLSPENNITREQVFAVLARAFKLTDADESALDKFSDKNDVSAWARQSTAALVSKGYVNGSDGKLNPKSNITRAEFAQIMYNIIKRYVNTPTTITGTIDGSVVVRSSSVVISKDAVIKGSLVICEGCENITIQSGAKIDNLVDNRNSAETETEDNTESGDTGTVTPSEDNSSSTDDYFWVVDPVKPSTGDSDVEVGDSDNTNGESEQWSPIYRPGH